MKKTIKILVIMVVSFSVFAFLTIDKTEFYEYETISLDNRFTLAPINISSTIPTEPEGGVNATSQQMAQFAWEEFIALNWPAKINPNPAAGMSNYYRGQPSSDKLGSTGSGGVVVWESFQHRTELFPFYINTSGNKLPDINAIPSYKYNPYAFPITIPSGVDNTLFNNLDEANEIGLCDMYYTPFAEQAQALMNKYGTMSTAAEKNEIEAAALKAGLVYEVKVNPAYFNYIDKNGYNNATNRNGAQAQTRAKIMNKPFTAPVFELPVTTIELKATWRRYDASMDELKDYHHANAIHYIDGEGDESRVLANDTFLLIGLHILQKTPSFPTFTFATFEHISNEKNGFRYKNVQAETDSTYLNSPNGGRLLPDDGILTAIRQYPIPDALNTINTTIQNQLRSEFGSDIVWANYRLIGVQAKVDNNPISRGGSVPDQEFFLSNFATETNDALQFFQGGLVGPARPANVPGPNETALYKADLNGHYKPYTAGGCIGCHGFAGQLPGGDFSVISVTVDKFSPEPTEPYPMGAVSDQNPALFPLPQKGNN